MPPPREVQCPQCGCLVPIAQVDTPSYGIAETRAGINNSDEPTPQNPPQFDPIPLQETPPLLPTPAPVSQPLNLGHSSSDFLTVAPNYSLATPDQPLSPETPPPVDSSQQSPSYEVTLQLGPALDDTFNSTAQSPNSARFGEARTTSSSSTDHDSSELHGYDDDHYPRRSWGWLLLASYASALTIACAWLLWQVRHPSTQQAVASSSGPTIAEDSRPDLGDSWRSIPAPASANPHSPGADHRTWPNSPHR